MGTRPRILLPPLPVPPPVVDWLAGPILHGLPAQDSTALTLAIAGNDSGHLAGVDAALAAVRVEILEDAITLEDEGVVRETRLRIVRAAPPSAPQGLAGTGAPPPTALANERAGIAAQIGAKTFADVRVTVVDGHTVRIGCRRASIRRTFRDLGFHAENSREPTRKWAMLLAICAGHGTFHWRDFGSFRAVSQAVSVLRGKLKTAFGLEDDPFHEFANGWTAKFFASSEA